MSTQNRLSNVDIINPVGRPWDIQPGEPGNWFMRFEEYRKLGTIRTVESVYEAEKAKAIKQGKYTISAVPMLSVWKSTARRFKWEDRAALWDATNVTIIRAEDAHKQQIISLDAETDRIEQRLRRKNILDTLYTKLEKHLENDFDLSRYKPAEIIMLLKILLVQNRAEFDDLPARELKAKFAGKTNAELIEFITEQISGPGSSDTGS